MPTIQESLDDLVANTTSLTNTVSGRITDMDGKITQANSAQVAAETAKTNAEIAETSAQTAQSLAEAARDVAAAAKVDAQTAKSDSLAAQSAASSAQGSAEAARDASIAADVSASTNKSASITAKNAAVAAQGLAETAETNAATSAAAANSHKIKAGQWADAAEDTEVETGLYSAKHYAAKAAIENTAAGVSENNALASKNAASASAGTASTKASEASASATASAGSASTASTKASEASGSASTASTQAGIATTKASEAAASASAAASSASAAAVTATNAVNAVIDTAPANLNTLNELAAALGDDANFATTVTNSIATKLPLAGGTMTGDVSRGDNVKAKFGASNDLEIYHNGSASYIRDIGQGSLWIQGTNMHLTDATGNKNYATGIQDGAFSLYHAGNEKLATRSIGIDVTGNVVVSGTVDGRDVATDGSKLDGIEAGATADQTAAEILTAVKTVDGSGSGLDADLLDGLNSTAFIRSDTGTIPAARMPTVLPTAGDYVWSNSTTAGSYPGPGLQCAFVRGVDGWPSYGSVLHVGGRGGSDAGGDFQILCGHGSANGGNFLKFRNADNSASPTDAWTAWKTIWGSGNDGSGSGLDADLLDGQQGSSYLLKSGGTMTGNIAFPAGQNITRTTHSSGFLEGSYNSVGANSATSNPIYTIGSNYNPSDSALENMYGIGYSHANFTGILAGWGMYVAASGIAKIGLDADGGNIRATGNITAYYSDERLKDFDGKIDNALDKVMKLNGYYFTENAKAKELGYSNDRRQVGVSAQEVEAVLPEVVTEAPMPVNDEDYKTVWYDKLVPLLIEGMKEQQTQIDELKALVQTLVK